MTPDAFILIGAAYLSGSVPFGVLIARSRGVDLRAHGSGNVGATNVGRVLGRRWGMLCFALDVFKGFVPTLAAGAWIGVLGRTDVPAPEAWVWLAVAVAAVLGHVFPVWLRFRGGKGVATGFGAALGVFPMLTIPALAALLVWLVLVAATKYVGISSCIAALTLPIGVAVLVVLSDATHAGATPFYAAMACLVVLVVWRHRSNIARTFAGTENRVGGGRGRRVDARAEGDEADRPTPEAPRD
ncbi:MAG: glycerol-3-phosphate 1-O-acyltransferase [Leptolyngbya sp. PLA2]|nr:glycerol-3-phosphate 1-O-acyltransferase [Leptolyngbya sp.]MCE7971775.1 glycerol-3-phosphate 1-O-acyltransferase [Leptolyngbya sp. PL-A2]MCZ7634416.1 glycerol-3-phosphate 1-O-acyltransferase PlsY [Phycisphaerales bacterium]MDL1904787.1 glycerol-3-phosphate 1-O-acyltransferase PlsY [Synechococcales cyanobacterium CNB]GIK19732.1 MAG: glycerol-3-phosphate acyltransferase [Planctomycetota bacterium]